ncbi:Hypothetical protein SMAX5B_013158 [Scophthalmus maximus]|uniref:Uncharacterized protein n=1 Tax=Scophthalmus maximus TaxID=52904 RepID=A0A2U9BE31_SCOMX|nr:Hypothetical protein SMAX5B_013158 [Scophthalmus maximus]
MNPYKGAFSVPGDALVFTEKVMVQQLDMVHRWVHAESIIRNNKPNSCRRDGVASGGYSSD